MLLQIILGILLGILAGTFSGLTPGVHINLLAALLFSFSVFLLQFTSPLIIIIFIVSMAISHTFIDFIPSILLGAPDTDIVLSVLPGHQFLKKGRAYEAIILTTYGSLFALIIILIISLIFLFVLQKIEGIINFLIPYILILTTLSLILTEKKKIIAMIVLLLSGFLGIASLNLNLNQPFLPLFTGLFGASSLIISIKTKTKIPKQIIEKPKIKKADLIRPLFASFIASPICCLMPGIGASHAAVISTQLTKINSNITKEQKTKQFLILLGAINTIVIGLSFVVFYTIKKTRTGISMVFSEILKKVSLNQIIIVLATILLSGILCFFWTANLAKLFSKNIHKFNYTKISLIILLILTGITYYFTGFLGFLVFIVSTATGIFGILYGVRRINLMGVILIPVILNYLF